MTEYREDEPKEEFNLPPPKQTKFDQNNTLEQFLRGFATEDKNVEVNVREG